MFYVLPSARASWVSSQSRGVAREESGCMYLLVKCVYICWPPGGLATPTLYLAWHQRAWPPLPFTLHDTSDDPSHPYPSPCMPAGGPGHPYPSSCMPPVYHRRVSSPGSGYPGYPPQSTIGGCLALDQVILDTPVYHMSVSSPGSGYPGYPSTIWGCLALDQVILDTPVYNMRVYIPFVSPQ